MQTSLFFSASWIGIGTAARAGFGSADPSHIPHRSAPNAAGLRRQARCIAAGNARHRHRGDDALGRGHHRLRRIVLSEEAKAGENELRSGSYVFESSIFALDFSRAKAGLIFCFYCVEAS